MGGPVPLGYDVLDRKLVFNEAEAATVRHILQRYVALGCGRALIEELGAQGYRTKLRPQAGGRSVGGIAFSRGMLFHLLGNLVYIGKVVHKGEAYPGEHDAIVPPELWQAVQATIARNRTLRHSGSNVGHRSLLTGILHDGEGRRMSPTHAVKAGKRYRYYVTPASELVPGGPPAVRLPAHDVETIVVAKVRSLLSSRAEIRKLVQPVDHSASALHEALGEAATLARRLDDAGHRHALLQTVIIEVRIQDQAVEIDVDASALLKLLGLEASEQMPAIALSAPAVRTRQGKDVRLLIAAGDGSTSRSQPLAALLAEALSFRNIVFASPEETIDQIARRLGRCRSRSAKLLRLSFLAPDIVSAIVDGQPTSFGVATLLHRAIPSGWTSQRALLGLG